MQLEKKFCSYCRQELDLSSKKDYHLECSKEVYRFNFVNYLPKNIVLKKLQFAFFGNHPIPIEYWKKIFFELPFKAKIILIIIFSTIMSLITDLFRNILIKVIEYYPRSLFYLAYFMFCFGLFGLYAFHKIKLPEELK